MDKQKRCKTGERKNSKGECDLVTKETKKPKQTLRNKKGLEAEGKKDKTTRNTRKKKAPEIEVRDEMTRVVIEDPDRTISEMAEPSPLPEMAPAVLPEEPEEEQEKEDPDRTISEMAEPSPVPVEEKPGPEPTVVVPINKNDFLLQKEKEEYDEDNTHELLYPTLNDPNFISKIANRQEFADTKYDGEITDIRKQSNLLCNAKFELMPHQLFVRNFLSFQTPYNSLLLYHGLGSGKTCSAIGIAEEMRSYMKQMGITKRIIIVASPNVQDNFRLQLFDDRRLEQLPDGTWNLNTCIGNSLLQEINPTNLQGLTRERIVSQIKSIIQNFYVFMGNKGEFANYIKKVTAVPEDAGYSKEEMAAIREKKIKTHFNNRLVILDEIHNIRISDSNKTKMTALLLNEVAKKSDNMRLLLLSATPMYNSYNEIIWLVNLLNANDKRGLIKIDDVFNSDGSFVEEKRDSIGKVLTESGKSLLARKLTGYVSYVRGENPYIFPYRIYPDTFAPDHRLISYPSIQMNQQEIKDPLQYIPIYTNGIGSYQSGGYQFIIDYLGLKSTTVTDKNGKERVMPNFENMESFGYTLLLPPLEALIMVYPNPSLDSILQKKELLKEKGEQLDMDAFNQEETKEIIQSLLGKQGLSNIMKFSRVEKPVPKRYDYEYKPKMKAKYKEIFLPENLGKYSAKIARICEIIKESTGIVMIYSQYIDGGLVPMALALESMGFSRYASSSDHNRNLLKTSSEPIDAITMQKRSQMAKGDFTPAKYVMITGEKDFSQKNDEDVKYVTSKTNSDGSQCKVILISMAASEGLDFKNIRQVHILEPWYNMNRIEQIIGRGVRNQSHCDLDFESRNVEIYLHGTMLDSDEESADLYVYRSAEKKAVQIGQVTRLMKENAVDCQLNIGQTNFTEAKLLENAANQNIQIRLSSGKTVPFTIGDKPRTEVCDYMADCGFTCAGKEPIAGKPIDRTTYDENFIKNNSVVIMKKIRDLFLERTVYKRNHLITAINFVKKYPIEHVYYALTRFINNKHEILIDKYGRTGHMVSRGEFYAFQPSEVLDETISTFERSVPVDYKPVSLRLELPKEIKTPVEADMKEVFEEISKEQPSSVRAYKVILEDLKTNVRELTKENVTIKASENNWFKHAAKVRSELLTTHELSSDDINRYVISHFLDTLPMVDKLEIVSYLYSPPVEPLNGYETILKEYFDELVLEANEDGELQYAVVLANGEENRMFVKEGENVWRPSKYTDEQLFYGLRKERLIVPKSKVNSTEIGFMHPFKQKEVVFKTKDLTQKRNNKGAKCIDSSKPVVAAKIGAVLGENDFYMNTLIERPELCVLLEVIMRNLTKQNAVNGGPVFFFGPEKANEMNLPNYK